MGLRDEVLSGGGEEGSLWDFGVGFWVKGAGGFLARFASTSCRCQAEVLGEFNEWLLAPLCGNVGRRQPLTHPPKSFPQNCIRSSRKCNPQNRNLRKLSVRGVYIGFRTPLTPTPQACQTLNPRSRVRWVPAPRRRWWLAANRRRSAGACSSGQPQSLPFALGVSRKS